MNCYLRWLKKTGEFCFATQLFTTVLKSKLSDSDTVPRATEKDRRSQMTTKLPIRVISLREIENDTDSCSETKRTHRTPVVLNTSKQNCCIRPPAGKQSTNDELWFTFSIACYSD